MTGSSDADAADDGGIASPARAAIGDAVRARLERNPMVSRIDTPHLEIFGRQDFLSPEECAELRRLIDANAQPSTLFSGSANADYRTSHSGNLSPRDPLVERITERICALTGLPAINGETLQGQRYTPGQEYKVHCDYFPATADYWQRMRGTGGQRTWTAMIYLSAVEAGGETHFPQCEFMVPPVEGMILIWNNMDRDGAPNRFSLHAALPVERGTKYVVTKWFRERPWG
ncbi:MULTISPECIES: prolyl hydroxylase family protein [Sphingobium]|jgi:prolyl 4-hydroxylase|uniref:prolyl hydroxylase family protein n=1 Tax=Sphingobium TaxID=165695 RepID=UPI000C54F9B5|nr:MULTISPECIES: 2OG-Fe(II) oxygenase [Sphingobium]MEC9016419.1 2OG-Fe(II) oxygenase [Pseudomonadota bacterium]MAP44670.1 2OG-Fe(II) oxygenase [Sphingobium sp.]MBS47535.1 2OG-Fe(II) oxygenase [Sphingobium sp.]MBS90666.1 2OG-Fe(II) oxygenase [Sphingobium sp.]MCC4255843.1 2OG-Fe(II) oxygenase [Sphingobium lactosutens]|tara:strand:+ start:550 stop:1239 length:690 start_codon:yes stop_codon:yes gene_type:complete